MMLKKIKNYIRQNFRCKHNWHFVVSHLNNCGIPTPFGDYIIGVECTFCGKKVRNKNKIRRIMREEGL